jgi:hypothetical protein
MTRTRQAVVVGLAALTSVALVTGTAAAATTTIRRGTATGTAYTGNVGLTLLGTASVTTSAGGGTCNQSVLTGSVNSNGSALKINTATFTNSPGPACPGGGSVTVTVTAQGLPWSGGNVTFDSGHTNFRDATATIVGFKVKAVLHNVPLFGTVTCVYGGNVTADAFNKDNTHRPDPTAELQAKLNAVSIAKQTGSDGVCPSTATVTADYKVLGETVAGSGTYNQTLYVTS